MRYVLLYESADDVLPKARANMEAHLAHAGEAHARGALVEHGPFGDPQAEGATALFTSREAAEEYAASDPFVRNGVVRGWQVREWHAMLGPDEAVAVARAYHDAWTGGRFDEAAALLADDLAVEVPINDYPTRNSFAAAVEAFGSMAERVELLSATGAGGEAVLLYDGRPGPGPHPDRRALHDRRRQHRADPPGPRHGRAPRGRLRRAAYAEAGMSASARRA